MRQFLIFTGQDIEKEFPGFAKKNLIYWQQKGYIRKLRNNYYYFSNSNLTEDFLFFAGNKIYHPSYISLESALSYYGIIPEGVYTITSVSTLKTMVFSTSEATFSYRNIKSDLFFGYRLISFGKHVFKIAVLEKAILDYLYFHNEIRAIEDFYALRWNTETLKTLDTQLLNDYLKLYDSKMLNSRTLLLKNYIHA